jgi:ComF family protein
VIRATYRYEAPADYFVQRLKFSGKLACAAAIAQLMLGMLDDDDTPLPDLLVPVPLHPRRIRERGFNQALEIARPLARQMNLPLDCRSCVRARHTEHQTGLSAKERRGNVHGAFEIRRALAARRIAIIDDVVTTGSTVAELDRVLRRAGARHVQVWAFARAAGGR